MKKLLILFVLASQPMMAQDAVELTIYFEDGSDVPSMPEMAMLDEIAQHPNSDQLRFSVVGHTDDKGSRRFNAELAKERTRLVAYHLLHSGIPPYNIIFESLGEDCPVNENDDESARSQNRRVEVLISNIGKLDESGFAGLYDPATFRRPLPMAAPEKEVFVIENMESNCIETASGSMIDIPPFAFMDAYGRPIGGQVEVVFQEMNDPFDVFLSGINMKSDECDPNSEMESTGMFSIQASHRGRPVEVRKDRPLQVELVSNSMDPDFDLMFLEPASASWSRLGHATINAHDASLMAVASGLSPAVSQYLGQTDYLSPAAARRITLEERFRNMEYLDQRPIASYYRFLRNGDENEQKQFEKEWKKAASFKAQVLPPHPNNSRETVHFTVQKHGQFNQHPEYFFFNFHVWEYAGELDRAKVMELMNGKRYSDVRVQYDRMTGAVALELKDLDGIVTIPVRKITIENMSLEMQKRMLGVFAPVFAKWRERKANRNFEDRFEVYSDLLAEQERRIAKRADRYDRRAELNYGHQLFKAWKVSQAMMSEPERMMSRENWTSYTNGISNTLTEYHARLNSGESVVRTIALDRMGIYACARRLEDGRFQEVAPRFVRSDGSVVNWKTCYVFDGKTTAVPIFHAEEANRIRLDPGSVQLLMVIDEQQNLYRLNETEAIAMNRGNAVQRIMHVSELEPTVRSLDEVKEVLGSAGE